MSYLPVCLIIFKCVCSEFMLLVKKQCCTTLSIYNVFCTAEQQPLLEKTNKRTKYGGFNVVLHSGGFQATHSSYVESMRRALTTANFTAEKQHPHINIFVHCSDVPFLFCVNNVSLQKQILDADANGSGDNTLVLVAFSSSCCAMARALSACLSRISAKKIRLVLYDSPYNLHKHFEMWYKTPYNRIDILFALFMRTAHPKFKFSWHDAWTRGYDVLVETTLREFPDIKSMTEYEQLLTLQLDDVAADPRVEIVSIHSTADPFICLQINDAEPAAKLVHHSILRSHIRHCSDFVIDNVDLNAICATENAV